MPKIPQKFLDCSIYLYDSRVSAEEGEKFGGSGCIISVHTFPTIDLDSLKGGRYRIVYPPHIYAVTNKHVVESDCPVIRLNTVDGDIDVLELDSRD